MIDRSETPGALPSLTALRAFEAAARWRSMTKAARELGVTHPAISRQVRGLERHLGARLVDRDGNGLALTPLGDRLFAELRDAFDRIALAAQMRPTPGATTLALTVDQDFADLWLMPRLAGFTRAHRDIELAIDVAPCGTPFPEGRYDAAILYGRSWPDGLRVDTLKALSAFPVCRPGLIASAADPRCLSRATLIHERSRDWWCRWLEAAGVDAVDGRRGHVLATSRLCLEAAAGGMGVAIGDDILAAPYLAEGTLVRPFATTLASPRAYCLVSPLPEARRDAVARFRRWLLAEAAAEAPSAETGRRRSPCRAAVAAQPGAAPVPARPGGQPPPTPNRAPRAGGRQAAAARPAGQPTASIRST